MPTGSTLCDVGQKYVFIAITQTIEHERESSLKGDDLWRPFMLCTDACPSLALNRDKQQV